MPLFPSGEIFQSQANSKFSNSSVVMISERSSPSPFALSLRGLQCKTPSFTSHVLFLRALNICQPLSDLPSKSNFQPSAFWPSVREGADVVVASVEDAAASGAS